MITSGQIAEWEMLEIAKEQGIDETAKLQAVEKERDSLKDLLRWLKCTQHTQSPCDESGSHYSALCEVCQKIEKALQKDAQK